MECPIPVLYAERLSVTDFIRFRWRKGGMEGGGPKDTVQLVGKNCQSVSNRKGHVVALPLINFLYCDFA